MANQGVGGTTWTGIVSHEEEGSGQAKNILEATWKGSGWSLSWLMFPGLASLNGPNVRGSILKIGTGTYGQILMKLGPKVPKLHRISFAGGGS